MRSEAVPGTRTQVVKALLFALLAANTIYFAAGGSASKFVDAAAWLTLLALFEAETSFARRLVDARKRAVVRALRLIAAGGVFAAVIGYVFEENVLDAVNAALWIAVVALLEIELRCAGVIARVRPGLRLLLGALYAGLAVLVVMWAVRGMWMDAYDAVLWLTAFVLLEHDIAGAARQ